MAEIFLPVENEMDVQDIKQEKADPEFDDPSNSNDTFEDPIKTEFVDCDFPEESSMQELISVKSEPPEDDLEPMEFVSMDMDQNDSSDEDTKSMNITKPTERLKNAWQDLIKFLKLKNPELQGKHFQSLFKGYYAKDGLIVTDQDVIDYFEFDLDFFTKGKSVLEQLEDLKTTLSEAYSVYCDRDLATDFPNAWKYVTKQKKRNYRELSRKDYRSKANVWKHFIATIRKKTKKSVEFTEEDFVKYFSILNGNKKKSKMRNSQIHTRYRLIKIHYNETFDCNFDEKFPGLFERVKHTFGIKPESQKVINMKETWNAFAAQVGKRSGFCDQDFIDYITYLKDEKNYTKRQLYDKFTKIRDHYNDNMKLNFDQDFPRVFEAIKTDILHPITLFKMANSSTNEDTSSQAFVYPPKMPHSDQIPSYHTFWQRFVNFSCKSNPDEILEDDLKEFIEHCALNTRKETILSYKSKLQVAYYLVHKRNFHEDFPNMAKFFRDNYGPTRYLFPKNAWKDVHSEPEPYLVK